MRHPYTTAGPWCSGTPLSKRSNDCGNRWPWSLTPPPPPHTHTHTHTSQTSFFSLVISLSLCLSLPPLCLSLSLSLSSCARTCVCVCVYVCVCVRARARAFMYACAHARARSFYKSGNTPRNSNKLHFHHGIAYKGVYNAEVVSSTVIMLHIHNVFVILYLLEAIAVISCG